MPGIYHLRGAIKHYDWGGSSFIPALLKIENKKKIPFAEYWLGIHPMGEALVNTGGTELTPLSVIASSFPFLLKVLDVKQMLSIQVHPGKAAAKAGFNRENDAGIPPDAPHRNYKDPNHKPELMVALSDFWLLQGFKPEEELMNTLLNVTPLQELIPVFKEKGYAGLYHLVMKMPQEEVNRILQAVLESMHSIYGDSEPDKNEADHWVLKAAATFNKEGQLDRGIFSIYLFNLVHLKIGEGIFQDAGVPHAYLEGQNVEIMANSDNVLRGGLSSKHIDVTELLANINCEATYPEILLPQRMEEGFFHYATPAGEFQLGYYEMEAGDIIPFTPGSVEVLLLTEGKIEVDDDKIALKLEPGNPSALIFPGEETYLAAATRSVVFRASGELSTSVDK